MDADYERRLAALDKRLKEIESGGGADAAELAGMRRELDRLKARQAEPGGGIIPGDPGLTRSLKEHIPEPGSDENAEPRKIPGGEYRGLRDPRAGRGTVVREKEPRMDDGDRFRLSEMAVGRYVVGILAAVLVLMGVCVGVGSFWWRIPAALKFAFVMALGLGMCVAGEYRIFSGAGRNGFWQALAGGGFMVLFAGITAGCVAWWLYDFFFSGVLYVAWFVACFLCAGRNGSRVFYLLAYMGGMASAEMACAGFAGGGWFGQGLACVIPVVVMALGAMDAFRTDDSFLWFLNSVFAAAMSQALDWHFAEYGPGAATFMALVLAVAALYGSQRLFKSDGPGMTVARVVSTFLTSSLVVACGSKFGQGFWMAAAVDGVSVGCGLALVGMLLVFVLCGMPAVMALGSAPVAAFAFAGLCGLLPWIGPLMAVVVSMLVLSSAYGVRSRMENAAVCMFAVLSQYMALDSARYDMPVAVALMCAACAAVAFAGGYKRRYSVRGNGYGCLAMAVCGTWACICYTGAEGVPYWVQLAVLCLGVALTCVHYMDRTGREEPAWSGAMAAAAVLALMWLAGLVVYSDGWAADLFKCVIVAGVPVCVLAGMLSGGVRGLPITGLLVWSDVGAWSAGMLLPVGIPVQAWGLVMACLSAVVIWLGFSVGRKDVRSTGLGLTIAHVLVIAGSTAMSGGTALIVLSLLGAGVVCFGISFAYNKFALKYDGEHGDDDGE